MPNNVNENVSRILTQMNMKPTEVAGHDLEEYDTIIFDADDTIWEVKNPEGGLSYAAATSPPYRLISDTLVEDSQGSRIRLEKGFKEKVLSLSEQGKSLYILSASDKPDVDDDNQPVVLLLKAFGIYEVFDDVIIDGESDKSDYVLELEHGETAFLDDNDQNLIDVSLNTDAEPIDTKNDYNLFGGWFGKTVLGSIDYIETKESIEEDAELAASNIYTQRSDEGELEFRVDLNNSSVKEVGARYRKNNPRGLYPGMALDEEVIAKMDQQNKINLSHYKSRLDLLEKTTGSDIVMQNKSDGLSIDDLVDQSNVLVDYVNHNLYDDGKINEDKVETLITHLNANSKFVAGVISYVESLRSDSIIGKIQARTLANQIANYEVYGAFDGHSVYKLENDIDFIPTFKADSEIDESAYIMRHLLDAGADMSDPETKVMIDKLREQIQTINHFISQGIYMYEDQDKDVYSDIFEEHFPAYVEASDSIAQRTEDIYLKMKNCANNIIDKLK